MAGAVLAGQRDENLAAQICRLDQAASGQAVAGRQHADGDDTGQPLDADRRVIDRQDREAEIDLLSGDPVDDSGRGLHLKGWCKQPFY
ncbi:MAG TPA: hypothetical protein VH184_05830 [Dongiaceae bacterium]|nr:hypothetical protein [Dongiaceae bacterium]